MAVVDVILKRVMSIGRRFILESCGVREMYVTMSMK